VPYPQIETEHSSGTVRAALHSGDPAYCALPAYFMQRLGPALGSLLEGATASGEIRGGISAKD